jgi:hypothetical protein
MATHNGPLDALVEKALFSAPGQILSSSASDVPVPVAAGADGQVIIPSAAATPGVKWVTEYEPIPFDEMVGFGNETEYRYVRCPHDATVVAVTMEAHSTGTSALGAYLGTVYDMTTGKNLLSVASYNLETLVADTETDITLTATVADRDLGDGDLLRFAAISNNADLVEPVGLRCTLYLKRR